MLWPLLSRAVRAPGRVAVVDDRGKYTYSQLLGGAMFLAEQIDAATQARHVGILLPTGGAFPIALMAAWLARRVAVPLNYLLSPEELTYVINDSDIDTIITAGPMLEYLAQAAGGQGESGKAASPIPPGINLLHVDQVDFTGMPPLRWPPLNWRDDLAVILYTSGTSGRPKGVMLTHGNLRSNVEAAIEHVQITDRDICLGVLPQFHSFGLTALTLLPLTIGAKVVYSARFTPKKIVELIRKHRPTIFMAVPSMYGALLSVKDVTAEDVASIRLPVSGGEPLPEATFEQYRDRLGLYLLEGYGLTETAPITNWCTPVRRKRRSVGQSLPGVTITIVDEHNRPLGPGEDGEVFITGPNIMKGYYKLPGQTGEVFTYLRSSNGAAIGPRYFRTGDIGRLDEEGFLYITGRKKEMLIIGGENVFPREIEEVLNTHPSVKDSAVVGKPDGLRGELPIAFVEVEEGQGFDETAVRKWCRERLAGYKVPREIRKLDALPRNPTGKIMRRHLPKDV